jgi:hypothetical protein
VLCHRENTYLVVRKGKTDDDFVETQRGVLDKFLKINPYVLTNPINELAIVPMEEKEPIIGISEEEEDIEINTNGNNVCASMCYFLATPPSVDETTNSSTKNTRPLSVDEPSFCLKIFMI